MVGRRVKIIFVKEKFLNYFIHSFRMMKIKYKTVSAFILILITLCVPLITRPFLPVFSPILRWFIINLSTIPLGCATIGLFIGFVRFCFFKKKMKGIEFSYKLFLYYLLFYLIGILITLIYTIISHPRSSIPI